VIAYNHEIVYPPPRAFELKPAGVGMGIDMRVVTTAPSYDGGHLTTPALLSPGETQRKRHLHRELTRQNKGTTRQARTKHQIALLSARETDRRKDWIEKTDTMVRGYDVRCIVQPRVKSMVQTAKGTVTKPSDNVRQKAGRNQAISAGVWALSHRRLTDKAVNATLTVLWRAQARSSRAKIASLLHPPPRPSALVLDVLPNDVARRPTAGCGEVRGGPEVVSVSADPVLRPELPEETPFNEFTSLESCTVGGYSTQIWTKNMDVVVLPVHLRQGYTEVLAHVSEHGS